MAVNDDESTACKKSKLLKAILSNKVKIIQDLESFKEDHKFKVEPSKSNNSLKSANLKLETTKRRNDEDLMNLNCKRMKLSKASESKSANGNVSKERLLQSRKYIRKKKKITRIIKFLTPKRIRKLISSTHTDKVLIVSIKIDKRLEELARALAVQQALEEEEIYSNDEVLNEQNIEEETRGKEMDRLEEKNDSFNEKEININNSLEIIQNNFNETDKEDEPNTNQNVNVGELENVNSTSTGHIVIKQEIDIDNTTINDVTNPLLENNELNIESDNAANEYVQAPEAQINCEIAQVITNLSNNPMPVLNSISSIQNFCPVTPSFIVNTAPFMVMPVPQYNPNIVIMNAGGFHGYSGMFSQMHYNPFIINSPFISSNFTLMQQPFNEQIYNPIQEMTRVQSTVLSLNNSQVSNSANTLGTQTDPTQSDSIQSNSTQTNLTQ